MANRNGNPTKGDVDTDALKVRAEAHLAVTTISDDLLAVEAQIAELAMVIEAAKADRTHTPIARLLKDMRDLQDKARQIRADDAAASRDTNDADVADAIRALEGMPAHIRSQILGAFEAPSALH